MRLFFLLIFILIKFICISQTPRDLFRKLNTSRVDTQKINILNSLTKIYINKNLDSAKIFNNKSLFISNQTPFYHYQYGGYFNKAIILKKEKKLDEALIYSNKALEIAIKSANKSDESNALVLKGTIHGYTNKDKLALEYFYNAVEISKTTKIKKDLLLAHVSLGIHLKKLNKITDALQQMLYAIKIAEDLKDSSSLFTICINLGSLYERTNDVAKATVFYRKALIINQSENNEGDKAIVYYKLGKMFQAIKNIDSARYYLENTLKIHLKRNDEMGLIFDYSNLATFNSDNGDYKSAELNLFKSIELALKQNDTIRINLVYTYLGRLYLSQKKYKEALKFYNMSLKYIHPIISKSTIANIYYSQSLIYKEQSQFKKAYDNFVLYKAWSDSSINLEETKKQTELKLNYDFENIQKKIESETKAKESLSQAEIEKQKIQRNYLFLGFLVICVFLIFFIKNYNLKKKANLLLLKQKREIEFQKSIVDLKSNEINDSINYAKGIQTATTPQKKELSDCFKNYDFFISPKDVVSGDFYWVAKTEPFSLVAVADCTGHGVPGAIMSVIGSMLLNEIFYVKNISIPNEVLTELNRLVKLTLRQDDEQSSNDGMDIAFCMLNNETNELFYSGANRPIFVINETIGLTEYKPTKVSIGGKIPLIQDYGLNKIQLQKGDTVVITSDGFIDQFGGDRQKKFTSKRFRNILDTCINSSAQDVKHKLISEFENWKGNEEQTDDVLVFIFKV